MILVRLTQLLVLAAGVALSLAFDWVGSVFTVHKQYVPWAIGLTISAILGLLLVWRRNHKHRMGRWAANK